MSLLELSNTCGPGRESMKSLFEMARRCTTGGESLAIGYRLKRLTPYIHEWSFSAIRCCLLVRRRFMPLDMNVQSHSRGMFGKMLYSTWRSDTPSHHVSYCWARWHHRCTRRQLFGTPIYSRARQALHSTA